MLRSLGLAGLILIGSIAAAAPASADNRVALVIGNGAYRHAPQLPNPANDATDVAAALKRSGFDVMLATDLDKARMDEAIIRFDRSARAADVALFYYSGHALQFSGVNYLTPVDTEVSDEADLRRMIRLDDIVAVVQQAKNLRILVLDACRNNPLAEDLKRAIGTTRAVSMQRGLARIDTPAGMIVAYSTQAGHTADDGAGRNSPYTAAFLRHVETREEIGTIFRRISSDVYDTTKHGQLPELSLSMIGEFYLNGKLQVTPNLPAGADPCSAAESHWRSAESIGTVAAYEDHLARFPSCSFAGLARVRIAALAAPARPTSILKLQARLDSRSEVPPNASAATGLADVDYDPATRTLSWTLTYSGLTGPATAAHFHGPAQTGWNAGVAVAIPNASSTPTEGRATLTLAQAADLLAGKWYINIHSATNPGGEIRGQVTKK